MKQAVSTEVRQRVLSLRHTHSLRQVCKSTGLPLGTVKTICSRSGAFRDNQKHRKLFSLPPIQESKATLPSVPSLPPQEIITGDNEVDAMLWLQKVVQTGQAPLIQMALEAAKQIKTPIKDLKDRYKQYLVAAYPNNGLQVMFSSIDFGKLEELAKSSIKKLRLATEATARFGDNLFDDTPAEAWCAEVLEGVDYDEFGFFLQQDICGKLFSEHAEFSPHTLSDCLSELAFWDHLYWLRNSKGGNELSAQAYARKNYVFARLAQIRPRTKEEAVAVLHYLSENEGMNRQETNGILLNLIGNGC